MWHRIVDTVQLEFSDVADVEGITRLLVRLLLAVALGGVLGFEREHRGKAAGVWMTAAIGIACGLGRESTALLSTLLALIVLAGVPRMLGRDRREGA